MKDRAQLVTTDPATPADRLRTAVTRLRPQLFLLISVGTVLMALVYVAIARWRVPFLRGLLAVPLLGIAILSLGHYTSFYPWISKHYFNEYEFYHYYIGAKYAPEIGYTKLYEATIIADEETKRLYSANSIRDLATGRYLGVPNVLARKDEIKARFSEERWAEFVKDIEFFKRNLGGGRWSRILRDKGYNATPIWGLTGGLISNAVSTDNVKALRAVALLDPALILLALLAAFWAFGHRAAFFAAAFFGINFLTMQSPTMKAAFLRTDWIMLTIVGAALIKKGWYKTAGGVMAYAGLARIFPVIFAFGIGARALVELARTRRIPWKHFQFFAAYAIVGGLLVGASVLYAGGLHQWREFFDKISYHNNDISTWRVGFRYVFLGTFDLVPRGVDWWAYKAQLQEFHAQWAHVWWGIQAIVLLASVYLARYLDDGEAVLFSFVPVFFLVAPTHYYYMMLVIPALFFAVRIDSPYRAAGLIYLILAGNVGQSYNYVGWRFPLAFDMSCALLGMVLYMMLITWIEGRLRRPAPDQ
ncbi:MAG TPA: hypothetical protein PKL84_04745 [Candidatus Hydrogenedentes bacterium]|nr:hypothetical protein [Candidatus Hydrogenedentota bacterium]